MCSCESALTRSALRREVKIEGWKGLAINPSVQGLLSSRSWWNWPYQCSMVLLEQGKNRSVRREEKYAILHKHATWSVLAKTKRHWKMIWIAKEKRWKIIVMAKNAQRWLYCQKCSKIIVIANHRKDCCSGREIHKRLCKWKKNLRALEKKKMMLMIVLEKKKKKEKT